METLVRDILTKLGYESEDEVQKALVAVEEFNGSTTEALAEHLGRDVGEIEVIKATQLQNDVQELTEIREGKPFMATTMEIRRDAKDERTIVAINTNELDRHGTIIDPNGIDLTNYRNNPVFLINHDKDRPAGNGASLRVQNDKIIAEVNDTDWNDDEDTEMGRLIGWWKRQVKEGRIRMSSVGIMPLEIKMQEIEVDGVTKEIPVITRSELLEFSFIPVGSNPSALVLKRNLEGVNLKDILERLDKLERLIGNAQPSKETDQGSSDEKPESDESFRYVEPRKVNTYVPPNKRLNIDRVVELVTKTIKQKQGKA